jgi:hypothetical protein
LTTTEQRALSANRPVARSATPARRRPVRDTAVAAASLLVLAFLVFFALAGPSSELRASIGPVVPQPGSKAVVEGRVLSADGGGLEGARVAVRRAGRSAGSATTDDAGAFRVELAGACAPYAVSVSAEVAGDELVTASTPRLCPGDALPVDIRVVTQGHFLWVPGPR